MQNEKNNKQQKTNLLNGIRSEYIFSELLDFLSKGKLVDFYKSQSKKFKERVSQTSSFNDIFDMVYPIYADEVLFDKEFIEDVAQQVFNTLKRILKSEQATEPIILETFNQCCGWLEFLRDQ